MLRELRKVWRNLRVAGFLGCRRLQKTLLELRRNFRVAAHIDSCGFFRMLYFAKKLRELREARRNFIVAAHIYSCEVLRF